MRIRLTPDLVSVIIVNYNRKSHLTKCLDSVRNQRYSLIETLVIDNASSDGSVEVVERGYPKVKLIVNETNELFCRAQNKGIAISEGKYILCLNSDVVLDRNFVTKMVEAMKLNEEIGMVSGKILSLDGRYIDSAGQLLGRSRKPVERGYRRPVSREYQKPSYVFGAGGVAPLYKRRMLEDIKIGDEYFDESYGMFYEDLDISWRANMLGWRAYYTPEAIAYHARGGTAKTINAKINLFKKYDFTYLSQELKGHLIKNRYLTMLKNDSVRGIMINSPFILAYEIKLWAYILCFNPSLVEVTIKNIKKYGRTALVKRRIIQRKIEAKPRPNNLSLIRF